MRRLQRIKAICAQAHKSKIVFADTEGTGLTPYHDHTWMWRQHGSPRRCAGARVFGVALGTQDEQAFVYTHEAAFRYVRRVLADAHICKIWHNYVYDKILCDVSGIVLRGPFEDTLLMARIWDDSKPHGLKPLYSLLTEEPSDDEVALKADLRRKRSAATRAGHPKGYVNYSFVDPKIMATYARGDVYKTAVLYYFLKEEIKYAWHLYELDKDAARIAVSMTHAGVAFNVSKARRTLINSLRKERAISKTLGHIASKQGVSDFSPTKNQKVRELLVVKGVPGFLLSKEGKPCTDAACLTALPANGVKCKEAVQVLEYRKLKKLNATYLEPLVRCANYHDGCVHAQWNVGGARSGRFSSSNPNLQNITRKGTSDEEGASLRALFIPRPGFINLYIDYSQVELRYLAALTQDQSMLRAYRQGSDLHTLTADRLNISRQDAKPVNFGIVYGEGAAALAASLKLPFAKAHSFINKWFAAYPAVEAKQDELRKRLHYDGYVSDFFGRRYYYPAGVPHKSINAVIQGGCSTILKMAMRNVRAELRAVPGARIIKCIHDELCIEFPAARLSKKHIRNLCLAMEDCPQFTKHGVQLVVEPCVAKHNWAEKVEVEGWR